MGGNALKTNTRRYKAEEYFDLKREVIYRLYKDFPEYPRACAPSYANKESYGDLDVLHTIPEITDEYLVSAFNTKEIVRNGPVISFEYKEFQVDLIKTTAEDINYAYHYFAFNDLGNLLGRLFKQFGLKHSHKGLYYPVRDGTHLVTEVLVTKDYVEALAFIGLEPKFFFNLEDIFEYVVSSPVFNAKVYQYENMNHVDRVRDAKRPTYRAFLKYIEGMPSNYVVDRPLVFEHFPELKDKVSKVWTQLGINKEVKKKFNGLIVAKATGLEGKELGRFMSEFKAKYTNDQILSMDVNKAILEEFNK